LSITSVVRLIGSGSLPLASRASGCLSLLGSSSTTSLASSGTAAATILFIRTGASLATTRRHLEIAIPLAIGLRVFFLFLLLIFHCLSLLCLLRFLFCVARVQGTTSEHVNQLLIVLNHTLKLFSVLQRQLLELLGLIVLDTLHIHDQVVSISVEVSLQLGLDDLAVNKLQDLRLGELEKLCECSNRE
jgi:hypothetical protein